MAKNRRDHETEAENNVDTPSVETSQNDTIPAEPESNDSDISEAAVSPADTNARSTPTDPWAGTVSAADEDTPGTEPAGVATEEDASARSAEPDGVTTDRTAQDDRLADESVAFDDRPTDERSSFDEDRTSPVHDTMPPDLHGSAVSSAPKEQVVIERRGGFWPALLGGIVAAGIGFGAGILLFPDGAPFLNRGGTDRVAALDDEIAAQTQRIDAISAQVEAGPDLSALDGLAGRVDDLGAQVTSLAEALETRTADLSNLANRVTELERRPISEGVSESAIQAYESELEQLQQAMADQRAEIEDMIAQAQEMEAAAAQRSLETDQRMLLTRIESALDEGIAFGQQVTALQETGLQVPQALTEVADEGVATFATLRESFPERARAALSAARTGPGTGSVSEFLMTQLGGRSLEPREGNDPDAVLSRAEAHLRSGDLQQALSELEALPEPALAEMQAWVESARARANAVAVVRELSASLASN